MKPAESGYADVNGLKLYYEVYGADKPIVLLHGSYMNIPMKLVADRSPLSKGQESDRGRDARVAPIYTFELHQGGEPAIRAPFSRVMIGCAQAGTSFRARRSNLHRSYPLEPPVDGE
jgi:hypothetical protein